MKNYALEYLRAGFSVIPIRPRQKLPDVRRWESYSKRRPSVEEIEGWFPDGSERNIAIICGSVSGGLFVVDFDSVEIFSYIVKDPEELARRTPVVKTSKGYHVYYRAPTDKVPKNRKFGGGKVGLDLKGERGYVIAPPSVHPSGARYSFIDGLKEPALIEKIDDLIKFLEEKAEEWPFVRELLHKWEEGRRQDLALGLSGFFMKYLKWPEERVRGVIEGICRIKSDEETNQRLTAVRSTFKHEPDEVAVRSWLGEDLMTDLAALLPQRDRMSTRGRVYPVNEGELSRSYYYLSEEHEVLRYAVERKRRTIEGSYWAVLEDWKVFTTPIRLNCFIDTGDEDPMLDIQTNGTAYRGTRKDVLDWLEAKGFIATPKYRKEALTALQEIYRTMGIPLETRPPWIGVYLTSPTMAVMWDAVPLKSEQEYATLEIRQRTEGIDEVGTGLQAFRALLDYFEPEEILPVIGAGMSGPFWHLLKDGMDFIFWPVVVGPHGIGKSRATEAFSHRLYGTPLGHASDIESAFRFAAHMDSCALPRVYGEAEHFRFDELSDLIKQATEFTKITMRGTGAQKMKRYSAVLAPMFNCNNYSIQDPNLKPRLLIVPFRGEKMEERKQRRQEFNAVYGDLRPVGKLLLDEIAERLNQGDGINTLKAEVERIREALEESGIQTTDHRRLYSWAVYLWGILEFDRLCRDHLQSGFLPEDSMTYLVEKVVKPIEVYNIEETVEDIFSAFRGWFEVWVERHTDNRGVRRGEGRVWKEDDNYYYVTDGIFEEFKRENREYKIKSMRALAQEVSASLNVPMDSVYKAVRYGKLVRKSLLLPKQESTQLDIYRNMASSEAPDSVSPGGGGGGGDSEPVESDQFENYVKRAMSIMRTDPKRPFKFVVEDIRREFGVRDYRLAQKVCFEAQKRLDFEESGAGG